MSRVRLIARIALFAALVYVFSWMLAMIPNVKVTFFIIFTAGFIWGSGAGMLVGMVGTGLWSLFNPNGPPASVWTLIAQMFGSALCGTVGTLYQLSGWRDCSPMVVRIGLVLCGAVCTAVYFVPVNLVDAWISGRFLEWLIASIPFTALALVSNAIIFPLLFGVTRLLYDRENARL
jgi:uncharacterized membrane protein